MKLTMLASVAIALNGMAFFAAEIPYTAELDNAAVIEERLDDLESRALPIGNGDLNALLWEDHGALTMRVAKNDLWDARIDTSRDCDMQKVDLVKQKWSGGGKAASCGDKYPGPRCAAVVRLSEAKPMQWALVRAAKVNSWTNNGNGGVMMIDASAGSSAGYDVLVPPTCTRLQFKIKGTAGAQYYVNVNGTSGNLDSGWKDSPQTEQTVEFAAPNKGKIVSLKFFIKTRDGGRVENSIREITLTGGNAPVSVIAGMTSGFFKKVRLDLRRAVAQADDNTVRVLADKNVFLIESDTDIVLEPIGNLPPPKKGETAGVKWLHVTMPGDLDYAGMEFALAYVAKDKVKVLAMLTSWDVKGGSVVDAAVRLARETLNTQFATLVSQHEAVWTDYWAASGVRLGNADLQLWWYRMTYMLRCFSKPGVMPAGLWAFQPTNVPNWHGDYHHNYNSWQPYWSAFIINHPAQADPWVDYMNRMLPRFKWLAKETYDCEGAWVSISSFAFEPDPAKCQSKNKRHVVMTPWGSTMGMIGMSTQVLWHQHLYQPDRQRLETKIYPVVKETALFFCSFAEKCPQDDKGKAKYGPSYSPEHGSFGVMNVPFDLAYAKFSLKAAITAAGEHGRDADLVARFRKALELFPDYPTAPDAEGKPVVVDWTGCKFRQIPEHNITVPAVPVFPGEQVTWFSPEPEKALFRNTLRQTRHRGSNSTIMLSVAKARLSMTEAVGELYNYYKPHVNPNGMFYWPGHGVYLSESTGIAAGISEFLLQSVDNIIRVFPCWPADCGDASFTDLRAQGGFLVSADKKGGKVTKVGITSTVGGKLKFLNPWTNRIEERATKKGEKVVFTAAQSPK